jgi:hypothetical protein
MIHEVSHGTLPFEHWRLRKREMGLPIAFMHIPKTAGTSVSACLHQVLQPKAAVHGLGRHIFGVFSGFDSMPSDRHSMIFPTPQSVPRGADLIGGHLTLSELLGAYPNAQVITFLREPISRLLSQWLFWRAWPWPSEDFWGAWGETIKHSRWTLRDFISDSAVATVTDNVYLRMLLAPHEALSIDRFIDSDGDDALLALAVDRLITFSHSDVIENPLFEQNLSFWLGKPFTMVQANQMPVLPGEVACCLEDELDDDTLELLRLRTRLDLNLWERVAECQGLNHHQLRVNALIRNIARYTASAGNAPTQK